MQWFIFESKRQNAEKSAKTPFREIDYHRLSSRLKVTALCGFNLPDPETRPLPTEKRLITWVLDLGAGASWTDISCWAELNRVNLTAWEARMLKRLSVAYHNHMLDKELASPYPAPMQSNADVLAQIAKVKAMYGQQAT